MNLKYIGIILITLAWSHLARAADIFDAVRVGNLETASLLLQLAE